MHNYLRIAGNRWTGAALRLFIVAFNSGRVRVMMMMIMTKALRHLAPIYNASHISLPKQLIPLRTQVQ